MAKNNKGFTLIEILVYIAILAIIFFVIVSFLIWSIRANAKAKVMNEVLNNVKRAMEIISYEIREASSIYDPTSAFGLHPGQLSLETVHYLPSGEESAFVDFYLCGTQLCFKKESQEPIALTLDSVEVERLVFTKVVVNDASSIQVDLTVKYNSSSDRSEYQSSINLRSAASLRSN
ncbi:MAG: hypothetical protein A3F15_01775 [Candidatus Wildermuthbacteria bacterium RIFCSPHIGHO2_12_FULL_40_12]|uniref:Type II secretion system protein n=1 Tax=Candidatus Wildermuthbacteria bacterium RIFCSPHIGHO2_12_FULL_40_12 TaxID=1802457 RepID=A0A1G2RBK8_9BACT|nr:MAG: hypothetical protein A3F15_01775 [Candidatus Wildermuthbacteria bacterium RIFCSPHIGHO2_12_FULL_40_12]